MADNIEQISLNFNLPSSSGSGMAAVGGTIQVDYTTSTVSKQIAASDSNGTADDTFSTFTLNYDMASNTYTIAATGTNSAQDKLSFSYVGMTPDRINNVALSLNGVNYSAQSEQVAAAAVCFASGTHLRVARAGAHLDVKVEDLIVGDLAVTASGAERPIVWIGHRTIDCARHPRSNEVMPVRIGAHAFGGDRPSRDLVVSPGHSIAVDLLGEVLIPASSLINGTTIREEQVERVTYWHIELDSHDLLVSENLATESYLAMDNRWTFDDGSGVIELHAMPDAPIAVATHADFCRPFYASGAIVDFVRERLAARATELGWTLEENATAGIHLVVDGRRVEPEIRGLCARFLLPADSRTVWLTSDTSVPAQIGLAGDLRALGVCIGAITVDDGFEVRRFTADDQRFGVGFHYAEEGPQRWTAGRARLPAEFWAGFRGDVFLRVDMTRSALPRWIEPGTEKARIALAS